MLSLREVELWEPATKGFNMARIKLALGLFIPLVRTAGLSVIVAVGVRPALEAKGEVERGADGVL